MPRQLRWGSSSVDAWHAGDETQRKLLSAKLGAAADSVGDAQATGPEGGDVVTKKGGRPSARSALGTRASAHYCAILRIRFPPEFKKVLKERGCKGLFSLSRAIEHRLQLPPSAVRNGTAPLKMCKAHVQAFWFKESILAMQRIM